MSTYATTPVFTDKYFLHFIKRLANVMRSCGEGKKMIEELIALAAVFWLVYKAWKTKKTPFFLAGVFLFCLQLAKWPFFLPILFSYALISFLFSVSLFYFELAKQIFCY